MVAQGVPEPDPRRRRIGRRSKRKGKRGELDAVRAWKQTVGLNARRSRQYAGTPESPDLELGLPGVYAECRRRERLNVSEAMARVAEEAEGLLPLLVHRTNRHPWLVTMRLSDLKTLARVLVEACAAAEKLPSGLG